MGNPIESKSMPSVRNVKSQGCWKNALFSICRWACRPSLQSQRIRRQRSHVPSWRKLHSTNFITGFLDSYNTCFVIDYNWRHRRTRYVLQVYIFILRLGKCLSAGFLSMNLEPLCAVLHLLLFVLEHFSFRLFVEETNCI